MRALCINCMEYTECREVPVGHEKGSQRDPYRDTIVLCEPCGGALETPDLATFHSRYVPARELTREDVTPRG